MNKYILIGSLCACLGGFFYGVKVTNTKWVAKTQTAINEAVIEARLEEKIKQDKVNEILQTQINDLNSINTNLNNNIVSLRNRPSRRVVSDNPQTNCKGASGRELSREDSEFLTRQAARADTIRSALKSCYSYVDSIQ